MTQVSITRFDTGNIRVEEENCHIVTGSNSNVNVHYIVEFRDGMKEETDTGQHLISGLYYWEAYRKITRLNPPQGMTYAMVTKHTIKEVFKRAISFIEQEDSDGPG